MVSVGFAGRKRLCGSHTSAWERRSEAPRKSLLVRCYAEAAVRLAVKHSRQKTGRP